MQHHLLVSKRKKRKNKPEVSTYHNRFLLAVQSSTGLQLKQRWNGARDPGSCWTASWSEMLEAGWVPAFTGATQLWRLGKEQQMDQTDAHLLGRSGWLWAMALCGLEVERHWSTQGRARDTGATATNPRVSLDTDTELKGLLFRSQASGAATPTHSSAVSAAPFSGKAADASVW